MVYQVSTVLIQHNKPAKSPLPVLTRGEKDRGIESQANLDKPVPKAPTLTELKILAIQIKPEDGSEIEIERQTAELGDVLEVRGVHLNGEKITAEFRHRLLFEEDSQGMRTAKPNKVKVTLPLTTPKLRIVLPAATDGTQVKNWPAGQYTLSLSIERDGKILPLTNEMPFLLAPRISAKPTISGSGAEPKLTIKFFPDIWKQQLEDRRVDIHDSTDQGSSRYGEVPGEGPRWGKHPGVVVNPVDPEFRGRMLVQVPDVWGPNVSSWAHPCVPWGGLTMGMYVVPPIGANVWVEFLNGDTERPIWTGFWWGSLADPPPSTKLSATGVTPQLFMESILKHEA